MSNGPIVRRISFDIHGEFITQLAREWFYTGEKSHEKVIEILMDSMTGTDTSEAQIRRYAEDILIGRAALKGSASGMGAELHERKIPGGSNERRH